MYDYAYSAYDTGMAAALIALAATYWFVGLILYVITVMAMWKIFTKAGIAGWKSIVPLLNTYELFKIAMGNGWLFLLLFVPIVNIVMGILFEIPFDLWRTGRMFAYLRYHIVCSKNPTSF